MAAATRHLGLGATLSTSFHSAYHLARWLGSLDVHERGRVAWNVVTSATDLEARNAGLDELPPREERYDRADEVLEACFALWNSWDADAFVLDKQAGVHGRPAKSITPTTTAAGSRRAGRSPSRAVRRAGPVIMQAGSSDRGREFAARWAEAIFTIQRGRDGCGNSTTTSRSRMQQTAATGANAPSCPRSRWCSAKPIRSPASARTISTA